MSDLTPVEGKSLEVAPNSIEGKVPYFEILRIIQENQDSLAGGIYQTYQKEFGPARNMRNFEDLENRVLISGSTYNKRINATIYVTPKEDEIIILDNHRLDAKYPRLTFHFNMVKDKWVYAGGMLHKTQHEKKPNERFREPVYWIDLNYPLNKPDLPDWLHDSEVKIEDLERLLGRYLHQALPSEPSK